MPQPHASTPGAPCWVDLFTSEPERTQDFYGRLFGWTAESPNQEFGGYVNFNLRGVRVAGCMKNDGAQGTPDVWSVYLSSDDAGKTVDAAVASGGQVVVPAVAVGDLGTMAVVTDVGQAAIGIWQPGAHPGFGIVAEPGAPSWFELHTRAYDASVSFYREVFRWDAHAASDVAEFRYTTLGEGDSARAGIMDTTSSLPDGTSPSWYVYFGVENADAALVSIAELGGAVILAAEDTPYGRVAEAADPTGARFKIVQAP